MVSPVELESEDACICGTLLGVFLRICRNGCSGTKYWYENGEIKEENF